MSGLPTLKHIKKACLSRYQKLPRRQRIIALAGAAVGALLVVYLLLLNPASTFSRNARLALNNERETLNFIEAHADQIRQINAARQAKTGQDTTLLTLASKTAGEHGLTLQRYDPGADGKLGLWLSDTEFNSLLAWLDQLVHEYNVQIDHISASLSAKPGIVEVQVILRQ